MTRLFVPAPRRALLSLAITLAAHGPAALAEEDPALADQVKALTARVQQLEALLARTTAAPATQRQAAPSPAPEAIDQRVRVLERKLEVAAEESAAAKAKFANVSLGERGLAVTSPEGNFEARLRGYVQLDGRFFHGDKALTGTSATTDTLLARRVRPIIEGTVYKDFYYRIMPDFAGSAFTLQDAYTEWRAFPQAKVAIGRFKQPVGLERLASASELSFVERGLTNNLVPNRDVGVQLSGEFLGNKLQYQAGLFNGVADGASVGLSDTNDDKDFAGRVILQPFADLYGPLQGLGFGVSGTYGEERGSATATALGNYVTPGQARFFTYKTTKSTFDLDQGNGKITTLPTTPVPASTVFANGERTRFSPQGFWTWRQFGVFGDYVESAQEVTLNGASDRITNSAWQVSGAIVLTGEDASFKGIKPSSPFNPFAGQWGAVELVGRYGELDVDETAFTRGYADITRSARSADSWGLGVNWYLNRNVKVNFDYDETEFVGGGGGTALAPLDRPTERVLLSRVQFAY